MDNIPLAKGGRDSGEAADWGRRTIVTLALTVLTSSQGLLIAASKAKHVRYDYSVTSANCTVNDLAARPDTHHRRPRSSLGPAIPDGALMHLLKCAGGVCEVPHVTCCADARVEQGRSDRRQPADHVVVGALGVPDPSRALPHQEFDAGMLHPLIRAAARLLSSPWPKGPARMRSTSFSCTSTRPATRS